MYHQLEWREHWCLYKHHHRLHSVKERYQQRLRMWLSKNSHCQHYNDSHLWLRSPHRRDCHYDSMFLHQKLKASARGLRPMEYNWCSVPVHRWQFPIADETNHHLHQPCLDLYRRATKLSESHCVKKRHQCDTLIIKGKAAKQKKKKQENELL